MPETAGEKLMRVFGRIDSLADEVPWTTGLSNMVEWLMWNTRYILGISKAELWRTVVEWCSESDLVDMTLDEKKNEINKRLNKQLKKTEQPDKYSKTTDGYYTPREGLRELKFFSEDYLNKEFDIFMSLVSDRYLDTLYSRFLKFRKGGHWATHGNSGIFAASTGVSEMQMDNLAYNVREKILVANELKLGGNKNPDQILKYSYMYNVLIEKQFIREHGQFLLLFLEDRPHIWDMITTLEKEIRYCRTKGKDHLITPDILKIAQSIRIKSYSWHDLHTFNQDYLETLDRSSQVERKLLSGFNHSLSEKKFMRK